MLVNLIIVCFFDISSTLDEMNQSSLYYQQTNINILFTEFSVPCFQISNLNHDSDPSQTKRATETFSCSAMEPQHFRFSRSIWTSSHFLPKLHLKEPARCVWCHAQHCASGPINSAMTLDFFGLFSPLILCIFALFLPCIQSWLYSC